MRSSIRGERKTTCIFCILKIHLVVGEIYMKVHDQSAPASTSLRNILLSSSAKHLLTFAYCPSCHRQLGQQQILSTSGGLESVSVRFSMNVPWLSPQPQQYVSMSSLDARVFPCPSGFHSTATLGMEPWSLCDIMAYPSPTSTCNCGFHTFLLAFIEKVLIWNYLRPEDPYNFSKIFSAKG